MSDSSTILTEEIILAKSGKKRCAEVTKINSFAMGITSLTSLKKFINLEVVSLSLNKISSLEVFSDCSNLKELHLRKNNIADITELNYLSQLPILHTLLLSDNPCTKDEGYRTTAICILKNLRKLDSLQVTDKEKLARVKEVKEFVPHSLEEGVANDDCNSDKNFATCIVDKESSLTPIKSSSSSSYPLQPPSSPPHLTVDDGSLPLQTYYSNTLLASKLILSDLNDSEVQQLQIWCAEELIERKNREKSSCVTPPIHDK